MLAVVTQTNVKIIGAINPYSGSLTRIVHQRLGGS